jgi:asparagine synthase (glutamine-hydrolysing)
MPCGILVLDSKSRSALDRRQFQQGVALIRPRGTELFTALGDTTCSAYSHLGTDEFGLSGIPELGGVRLYLNGLINNTDDLADILKLPDAARRSDGACLQYAWRAVGATVLQYARGMFTIVIDDGESIRVARDTNGIKPAYTIDGPRIFGVASKAAALAGIDDAVVRELTPGHLLEYSRRAECIVADEPFRYEPYHDYGNDLEACLRSAVVEPTVRYLRRCGSRPVGLIMRGDVGSAVIARMLTDPKYGMPRDFPQRLTALCFENEAGGDLGLAQAAAREMGLRGVWVKPRPPDIVFGDRLSSRGGLRKIVHAIETGDPSAVITALSVEPIADMARRRGIQVLISGDGAKENFGGLERFTEEQTPAQSADLYARYLDEVFPTTVLQPLDRLLGDVPAEGRVPFLDPAVVALARGLPPDRKAVATFDHYELQVELRSFASAIGVPDFVTDRHHGGTLPHWTGVHDAADGLYYRNEARARTGLAFPEILRKFYGERFVRHGRDVVSRSGKITDAELTRRAKANVESADPALERILRAAAQGR